MLSLFTGDSVKNKHIKQSFESKLLTPAQPNSNAILIA